MRDAYGWEVELTDHRVICQYNPDGSENPSSMIPPEEVVRASVVPRVGGLPPLHILLDRARGERFVHRFGRGIMKDRGDGTKLVEYLHCIVTTHYRLWIFSSSGQALVTNPEYELYP